MKQFMVTVFFFSALSFGNTWSKVSQDLTWSWFRQNEKSSQNEFVSPVSLALALGMAQEGASGATRKEFSSLLKKPKELGKDFISTVSGEDPKLRLASSLIATDLSTVKEDFQKTIEEKFLGSVTGLRPGVSNTEVLKQINDWVQEKTRIENFLSELPANFKLILLSAVDFEGAWLHPFVKSFEGKFNGKKHPMMRSADMQVKYASLPNGWQAVELPYATPGKTEGTRNASPYRFWAFLPPEKGGVFQEKVWKELVAKADHQMGTIEMPKFTLEKETDLAEWFRKAGLKTAFDPARADFSKITGKKDLYLSKALHKARIQVDELGTKAGAATGMAFSVRGATNPFYLKLDRPFYFTLVHEPTQAVLFAGRFVGAGFPR